MKIDPITVTLLSVILLITVPFGAKMYNDLSPSERCEIVYDTSFNGLYIYKLERCFGPFGWTQGSDRIVERRELFRQF